MSFTLTNLSVLVSATAQKADASAEYEAKKAAFREKLKNDDVTTDDLLIGSWVSFYSFEKDSYEDQLDQMAAAGINFNIFPRNFAGGHMYDAAYWEEVETQYASRNMVYLMNGSLNRSTISVGAEYAAGKEHCIGYHVIDEPTGEALPEVADVMRAYREADPTRYPFTNLYPSYAGETRLGGTYREHVERYVALVGAENMEYLSHDYYPFKVSGENMGIFADMEVIRSVAYENGKLKTHAFPQSTRWTGMRMPNIDEMRWNVYAYLAYGFKALSWFNLVCPGSSDTEGEGFSESLIYRDGAIHDPLLFAAWGELNWEIRGLSDALMNLDTVHAYHTDETLSGVEYLPSNYFITPIGSTELVISYMEAKDGTEPYIMIFNKSLTWEGEQSFFLDFTSGIEGVEYLDPHTGEYIPMNISDGILRDSFSVGEGKLYRLKGDIKQTVSPPETPTMDLEAGFYNSPQAVSISTTDRDAVIYYTLDGSYPTAASTLYEGPITLGKAGESSFHTLRAVAVKGSAISDVLTRSYIIGGLSAAGNGAQKLTEASPFGTLGAWENADGKLSLTSADNSAFLNHYIDTSRIYDGIHIEAVMGFGAQSSANCSAGILIKEAEGDGYLSVNITKGGSVYIYRNGRVMYLPEAQGKTVDVSDGFALRMILSGNHLRIEADGQLLVDSVSKQFEINGYVGISATRDSAITAESVVYTALSASAPPVQEPITKITGTQSSVTVAQGATREDILALLPTSATVFDASGSSAELALSWELEGVDTSSGGTYTVKGYPVFPANSLLSNPNQLALRFTVRVLHDPDRTELLAALSLFESLKEEHYSPASWQAAKEFYLGSLEFKDADVPQNAVTVAAVFLMDRINALDPTGIDFSALDEAIAALSAKDPSTLTDEEKQAVQALLTEAESFARKGPVTQAAVDDLTARLAQANKAPEEGEKSVPEDSSSLAPIIGASCAAGAALAAGAAVVIRKRKKKKTP